MALDALEVTVAGTGALYIAPVGSTLPAANTDPTTTPNASFIEMGYIAEEGATLTSTPEISEFKAWQSSQAIRRGVKTRELQIAAKLLQWNETTVVKAFGGGSVVDAGGFPTYTFPVAGEALDEYAVILDVTDGDRHSRLVVPRMNGVDPVEAQFNADSMAELPLVLKSLAHATAPYWIFDDDAAFATAS